MAKRAARKIAKSSRKVPKRAPKAIKKHSKKMAKKIAQQYNAQTSATTEREAWAEERFRELTAWYVLQGMNEASARQRARDEMRDDPSRIDLEARLPSSLVDCSNYSEGRRY